MNDSTPTTSHIPSSTYEEWMQRTTRDLKGADFDRKLVSSLLEGLHVQPLYTPSHPSATPVPNTAALWAPHASLTRLQYGWDARQSITLEDPARTQKALLEDLEQGATSVEIHVPFHLGGISSHDLQRTLEGVRTDLATVSLSAGQDALPVAALTISALEALGEPLDKARIHFGIDPLASSLNGFASDVQRDLSFLPDVVAWANDKMPCATPLRIDTTAYHNAGAHNAQALAIYLSSLVEVLRTLTRNGISLEESLAATSARFCTESRFFLSISTLRAARLLHARVAQASGSNAQSMVVEAVPALREFTLYDPWVNLLRNTACIFAGAVGGADTVLSRELVVGGGSSFSRRQARNVQTVLAQESHIAKVADPAQGSHFIEHTTSTLCTHAWDLFQTFEKHGGMLACLRQNIVQDAVEETHNARAKRVARRKDSITGVSQFPNLAEPSPQNLPDLLRKKSHNVFVPIPHPLDGVRDCLLHVEHIAQRAAGDTSGDLMEALVDAARHGATLGQLRQALHKDATLSTLTTLPIRRTATPFEDMRDRAHACTAAGREQPTVFLAALGNPAQTTARVTFARNLVQCGGFDALLPTKEAHTPEELAAQFRTVSESRPTPIVVLCSTDALYAEHAADAFRALSDAGASTCLLAGRFGDAETTLRQAGATHAMYAGCDTLSLLGELWDAWIQSGL